MKFTSKQSVYQLVKNMHSHESFDSYESFVQCVRLYMMFVSVCIECLWTVLSEFDDQTYITKRPVKKINVHSFEY